MAIDAGENSSNEVSGGLVSDFRGAKLDGGVLGVDVSAQRALLGEG